MKIFKKITLYHLIWLVFYIAFFSFALKSCFMFLDHDFPWHLRIGQQIITEQAAPTIDYYNHTIEGRSWVDHEWLFNAFFFYLYDTYGYISLNIFFALILTLSFILLNIFTHRFFIIKYLKDEANYKLVAPISMVLQAYAIIAFVPFLGVRMQILGNFFFILIIYLLESYNQSKNKYYLLVLPLLFILWTNLHGSFLIGLVIIWMWFGFKLLERILSKIKYLSFETSFLSKNKLIFSFVAFTVTTFSTLINPYGYKLYSFLSTYQNSYYLKAILEWRPFYYLPIMLNQVIILAIASAVLLLYLYSFSQKSNNLGGIKYYLKKINLWYVCLSILFIGLAFKSKRHFPLFLYTSFALCIQFVYFEFFAELKLKKTKKLLFFLGLFFALATVTTIYNLKTANISNDPFSNDFSTVLPYEMVDFIQDRPKLFDKVIFNDYSWGGYFLWALPDMKFFIDGRMPQVEYDGHSLLEEYSSFFEEDNQDKMLSKHNIDLAIVQHDPYIEISKFEKSFLGVDEDEVNSSENFLINYLEERLEWEKIYSDGHGAIYLKQN